MEQLAFPFLEWQVSVPLFPQPAFGSLWGGYDWHWSEGGGSTAVATHPEKSYAEKGVYYNSCPFKVGTPAAGGIIDSIKLVMTSTEEWCWVLSLRLEDESVDGLELDWNHLGYGREREWIHEWDWREDVYWARARDAIIDRTERVEGFRALKLDYNLEGEVVGLVIGYCDWAAVPQGVRSLVPPELRKILDSWWASEMV